MFQFSVILLGTFIYILFVYEPIQTQSIARIWNEQLLSAIRLDYARPTVHSRNLFHSSIAMYDSWAIFDETAETYLLGKTLDGFSCPYNNEINYIKSELKIINEETFLNNISKIYD